jgi:hypothetical protein
MGVIFEVILSELEIPVKLIEITKIFFPKQESCQAYLFEKHNKYFFKSTP